jgi:hypothetical protein
MLNSTLSQFNTAGRARSWSHVGGARCRSLRACAACARSRSAYAWRRRRGKRGLLPRTTISFFAARASAGGTPSAASLLYLLAQPGVVTHLYVSTRVSAAWIQRRTLQARRAPQEESKKTTCVRCTFAKLWSCHRARSLPTRARRGGACATVLGNASLSREHAYLRRRRCCWEETKLARNDKSVAAQKVSARPRVFGRAHHAPLTYPL